MDGQAREAAGELLGESESMAKRVEDGQARVDAAEGHCAGGRLALDFWREQDGDFGSTAEAGFGGASGNPRPDLADRRRGAFKRSR